MNNWKTKVVQIKNSLISRLRFIRITLFRQLAWPCDFRLYVYKYADVVVYSYQIFFVNVQYWKDMPGIREAVKHLEETIGPIENRMQWCGERGNNE